VLNKQECQKWIKKFGLDLFKMEKELILTDKNIKIVKTEVDESKLKK
jgi:hypothetical protein